MKQIYCKGSQNNWTYNLGVTSLKRSSIAGLDVARWFWLAVGNVVAKTKHNRTWKNKIKNRHSLGSTHSRVLTHTPLRLKRRDDFCTHTTRHTHTYTYKTYFYFSFVSRRRKFTLPCHPTSFSCDRKRAMHPLKCSHGDTTHVCRDGRAVPLILSFLLLFLFCA